MLKGFGVYAVLFSEIGVTFFVGTMAGVLAGWFVDQQLNTLPVFTVGGALAGFALGGLAVARLITRFLARFDDTQQD
jgi:F0F1-type ATP synthase assembly protein I